MIHLTSGMWWNLNILVLVFDENDTSLPRSMTSKIKQLQPITLMSNTANGCYPPVRWTHPGKYPSVSPPSPSAVLLGSDGTGCTPGWRSAAVPAPPAPWWGHAAAAAPVDLDSRGPRSLRRDSSDTRAAALSSCGRSSAEWTRLCPTRGSASARARCLSAMTPCRR